MAMLREVFKIVARMKGLVENGTPLHQQECRAVWKYTNDT
jgi:hypothetical protein